MNHYHYEAPLSTIPSIALLFAAQWAVSTNGNDLKIKKAIR